MLWTPSRHIITHARPFLRRESVGHTYFRKPCDPHHQHSWSQAALRCSWEVPLPNAGNRCQPAGHVFRALEYCRRQLVSTSSHHTCECLHTSKCKYLTHDARTAAIRFHNGTVLNLAKVDGSLAYQDLMRAMAIREVDISEGCVTISPASNLYLFSKINLTQQS